MYMLRKYPDEEYTYSATGKREIEVGDYCDYVAHTYILLNIDSQ